MNSTANIFFVAEANSLAIENWLMDEKVTFSRVSSETIEWSPNGPASVRLSLSFEIPDDADAVKFSLRWMGGDDE